MGRFYEYPSPNAITGDEIIVLYQDSSTKSGSLLRVLKDSKIISIDDLGGVDTQTNSPIIGQVLTFDGNEWKPGYVDKLLIYVTSSIEVNSNHIYAINTTNPNIHLTLPAAPIAGDTIGFFDIAGAASTNSPTIVHNGKRIMDSATDMTFDINYKFFELVFVNNTLGWRILDGSIKNY